MITADEFGKLYDFWQEDKPIPPYGENEEVEIAPMAWPGEPTWLPGTLHNRIPTKLAPAPHRSPLWYAEIILTNGDRKLITIQECCIRRKGVVTPV